MSVDSWLIVLVLLLCLIGIVASLVPTIPGGLINYIALLLIYYKYNSFSKTFLIVWAVIMVLAIVIDYFMPVWFAKKYGFTMYRLWFSLIGMVIGIFFTPVGMVLGMLIGALAGEIIGGREKVTAIKKGIARFAGTMLSIVLKLIVSIVLSVYIFVELTRVAQF